MEMVWWEKVPNAVAFVSDIVERILSEKSLMLIRTDEIPWYSYMVRVIKESVKSKNSSKHFETVVDELNPGVYLLKGFCKEEKRADYRPTKAYSKFFADSDDIVLHDNYFWVEVKSKEQLDAWVSFVSDYVRERGKNKKTAVFILEWAGDGYSTAKKGIKVYNICDYISQYDRIVFCTLAASSVRESSYIKDYLTELVAAVADSDMELCAQCLECYREFLQDPHGAIQKITSLKVRSDGDGFRYEKSETEVEHLIWKAQIKTVYPALEEYREEFVRKHSEAIQEILLNSDAYSEDYCIPEDVELGPLKRMADLGQLKLSMKEYNRLRDNREARNKLSHLSPLSLDEIKNLIR